MVIWIIGLSGSGKTYLATEIYKKIKKKKILIDGDLVRKYITHDLRYSKKDRKKNSILISNLCKFLESLGFTVVCPILSMFPEHQKKNREKFNNYFQICLKTKLSILKKRNNKNIYGNKKNIVGKDILFPKPYKNDLIIENNFKPFSKSTIHKIINKINVTNKNKKNN